ncbi:glycosyltransferase family 4 protein [Pleionea sediminis]|uniref:glycosyltransferase family 4 protein n=1 Tax=Pleionea sediminis TaxID=2569479 RepID=UPI0011869532|nr:glycosyltransferase family 4 protein [Pleionea sediminis]
MVDSKPYVLFIETGYKYNIENLYKHKCELISKNFRGQVITFGDQGDYQYDDVKIKVFPILSAPKLIARYIRWLLKIIMLLRTFLFSAYYARKRVKQNKDLDLIVTYDPLTTGVMGVLVSKLTKVPLVVEVNGDYTDWTNFSHIKNKYWRSLKRKLAIRTQKFVFKHCAGIKLLYKTQIDWAKKHTKNKQVKVYPNYLNIRNFKFIDENKTISIIGFPFDVKGIDIAIAAFKEVSDKYPDWQLEILGYYPDNEKELIEKHINGHKRITRLTPIDRKLMEEYVGKTGIVLCASRTEGFPRVIKEAMMARKPCIVSDVGGLGEVFSNGQNGLMFESENIDELAERLRTLIDDDSLRKKLGKNAEVFAKASYSDEAFINNVSSFYNDVIKANQSS